MNSWKHDTWWFAVSFAFVCGISLGGFIGSLWDEKSQTCPPAFIYNWPSVTTGLAANSIKGKRSEPGVLSPETKRKIELLEIFNGRDPFEKVIGETAGTGGLDEVSIRYRK